MNIFLVGYMGSGKSFLGKILARYMQIANIDLDAFLQKRESMEINKIFTEKGESYFRVKENKYLLELIKNKNSHIISCGGGTPFFFNNMEIMNKNGITIYLKRDSEFLYNYLLKSISKRPVFDSLNSKEKFFKHFEEREFFYLKSKLIINCDNFLSSEEIIQNIKSQLYDYRFKK
tara:strand:+ start:253 stop:777 length:525 start_codon:yes stop_codon:yes gene_type:complete